jgi:pimeloyl-ACP methyl ester carboxylesterase
MDYAQTHLQERELAHDSVAHLIPSIKPDGRVMIFVHGYGGADCMETWSDFPRLLPLHPQVAGCDFIFYGYDGLRADLVASAGLFERFLNDLLSGTAIRLNAALPISASRPAGFSYNKIMLVGHSLGAVILRWALLDARSRNRNWLEDGRIRFMLYAPAHSGADVVALAREILERGAFFLRFFSGAARFVSPLIDQLKPNSEHLQTLARNSRQAMREVGPTSYLKPAAVVIAEYENIVRNIPFCEDGPAEVIQGTNHISICKPTEERPQALTFALDCL